MNIADVVRELEQHDGGPIPYSVEHGELVVGHLAVGKKPFGLEVGRKTFGLVWPDGKWGVYFCTKNESFGFSVFDVEDAACENFLEKVLRDCDLRRRYGRMNKADLKIELDRAGINPNYYNLEGKDYPGDQYVLDKRPDGKWTVSYTERGNRRETVEFDSESEAAIHLLDRTLLAKEWENRHLSSKKK
jgi:hypothetical protein